MGRSELSQSIKLLAEELGFDKCGIAPAGPLPRSDYLHAWLQAGRAGTMRYLHRYLDRRTNPSLLLDGARSVIVVALLYRQDAPAEDEEETARHGRVARYAWGEDYHRVVKEKLFDLVDRLRARAARPFETKVCVDTAPLLERELALAAGIGWIGKNTMVLNRGLGSYFFLGEAVTTLELTPDEPMADGCGTCTACLDACPTKALIAPYQLDASRCISYLTIEHRGEIPEELASMMGDWVFGCDVCQEVCPYNRRAPVTREPRFAIRPPAPRPRLDDILQWTTENYRAHLRHSAMKRANFEMLQRNIRIAQANLHRQSVSSPGDGA